MEAIPKKLLDQACTERGTPSRPEPAEGLSKGLHWACRSVRDAIRLKHYSM